MPGIVLGSTDPISTMLCLDNQRLVGDGDGAVVVRISKRSAVEAVARFST